MTASTTEYPFLDDPAEIEWLTTTSPEAIRDNAHRIYEFMGEGGLPSDSFTRELAFEKASKALGLSYETFYDAWMSESPISEETK